MGAILLAPRAFDNMRNQTMPQKFQMAFALHQQGQLAPAQVLYEEILTTEPGHFDALQLLGAIAAQRGDPQRALNLFNRAIAINGTYSEAHFNRGVVLQQLNQMDAALASYDKATALKHDHAHAWFNRGNLLRERKQLEAALASYDRALASKPRFVEALSNRGNVQRELRQLDAALASYNQAISLDPSHLDAHCNRANLMSALERWDAAVAGYTDVLKLKQNHREALVCRGIALKRLARRDAAMTDFDQAIALDALHADAHFHRANLLGDLEQWQAALASYDRAIALRPQFVEALTNRGNVLREIGEWDSARDSYDLAIAADAEYAMAWSNRGALFAGLDRLDEALADYDRAITLEPACAEAYSNRGNVLQRLRRLDEALASHNQAIAINGNSASAHFNKSIALLLSGDLDNGWVAYEWRWKDKYGSCMRENREFSRPLWLGKESLQGKTILLYSEQGIGDTLQFCRYARLVADLGAQVVLEAPGPLAGLLRSLQGVSQVVERGDLLPTFDFRCPLMSLPLAFGTKLDTIPAPRKYLRADEVRVARWRMRLGKKTRPRIGLVWSGSPHQISDKSRSMRLEDLLPHLPRCFEYVSLQKEVRDADRAILDRSPHIFDPSAELSDFSETAALCECMDVVISVCTSVAHLCGGLDKKTWILLSFAADWRWMLDRDDSPWYPAVKLYRQEKMSVWNSVLERVAADLMREFKS